MLDTPKTLQELISWMGYGREVLRQAVARGDRPELVGMRHPPLTKEPSTEPVEYKIYPEQHLVGEGSTEQEAVADAYSRLAHLPDGGKLFWRAYPKCEHHTDFEAQTRTVRVYGRFVITDYTPN